MLYPRVVRLAEPIHRRRTRHGGQYQDGEAGGDPRNCTPNSRKRRARKRSARPGRRRRTRLRMRRAKPGNQRPKRVRPPGAVVLQVDPQSAAERAGLKPGDLVTELDGTPVRDAADLQLRLALLRIGEVAEFAVSRPGGAVTVRAAMAEREPAARSK